ncbi:MAG: topoisomerase DNA-binding C4 zinc finger domain-containing protein, partial [Bacilli bacterium]|nr:topoisomerase DNA-binding C4 zinc finger domain-containing protein [Bacilli bacterium]
YNKFEPLVDKAFAEMEKKAPLLTGEKCPECKSDLVIRKGRYGVFTACSNYPTCKYIKKEEKEKIIVCKCPECDYDIIQKPTRKGKLFYGCSNYPSCKFALWDKPTGDKCPKCSNLMVEKGKIIKCSSCDYKK